MYHDPAISATVQTYCSRLAGKKLPHARLQLHRWDLKMKTNRPDGYQTNKKFKANPRIFISTQIECNFCHSVVRMPMPMAIPERHRKQSGIWKFGCQFWTIFLLPTCFEVEKNSGLTVSRDITNQPLQPILGDADTCFICCDSIWFNFENSRENMCFTLLPSASLRVLNWAYGSAPLQCTVE